jgi:hypothetical protein
VINSQKVQAVAAQHRWIHHYKHLFIPLVGTKSHFFVSLEAEMKGLAPEKRTIVAFEEIEKQPKLIRSGQMKEYQVRGVLRAKMRFRLTHALAPWVVFPRLDAQEWCVHSQCGPFFALNLRRHE